LRADRPTDYRELVDALGGHSLTKLVPVALHGLHMAKSQVTRFSCPNCDASYMVVQVRAAPATLYCRITCRSCDGPLEAQKGRFILKYFLLEERRKGPAELSRKLG
jgi:hypothetical protein